MIATSLTYLQPMMTWDVQAVLSFVLPSTTTPGSPGFCVGILGIGVPPVDGREGHGTDVKGVAWVVIQLQLVSALLLTHAKHLLCRLLDLHTQTHLSSLY